MAAASPATGWRMWLPSLGMALCVWLSFVDRQVLAVLAPTILKETGMSAQDFGNVVFFFFVDRDRVIAGSYSPEHEKRLRQRRQALERAVVTETRRPRETAGV